MMKPCFLTSKVICFFLLILVACVDASKFARCPFSNLFHFGDGFTDIGNTIYILPSNSSIPAAKWPYGRTYPGWPTGRWCDGMTDFDFSAAEYGLPHIVPYKSMNAHEKYDGVIFSVARSPVLDIDFFESRGVNFPPYATPLSVQINWFKDYFYSLCSKPEDCRKIMQDSILIFGDMEGNDIGYPLAQGKSIEEVQTYAPLVIESQINATRELIRMGATNIIIPENIPLGCYPYILTALRSNDPTAYDGVGCLKSVNNLILSKNKLLEQAIEDIRPEFPDVFINMGTVYDGAMHIIRDAYIGPNGRLALKACCGIGGKYNYDTKRFCGSPGVPVCDYPNTYIFWDGLHFTQIAYSRLVNMLLPPALEALGCTLNSPVELSASM